MVALDSAKTKGTEKLEWWQMIEYSPNVVRELPGRPKAVEAQFNNEINVAFAEPKLKARLADVGGTVLTGSPAEFGRLIADETDKWGKVVKFTRQIDPAPSVAVAPYCRFATPVPPHAGQVVTWVSLSRGRFGNKPSEVSSHDICPPPWQMGHWRVSSSAIQRSVGFVAKGCCASDEANHLRFDCCAFLFYSFSTKSTNRTLGCPAVFALRWSLIAESTRP